MPLLLSQEWTPADLEQVGQEFDSLKLPSDGKIQPEEAAKLQIAYQAFASKLSDLVAQAHLYEKRAKYERDREYTTAFLGSQKTSDRQREAEAKASFKVMNADRKLFEAEVYRKFLEDKREDAIRSHYALRAILKDRTEDRWMV